MRIPIIQPYDTTTMKYDYTTHRYVLTKQAVVNVGNNYNLTDEKLTLRLKEITNNVYGYIYRNAYQGNRYYIEWLISCSEEGRQFIESVLTDQLLADLESRLNDLSKQSPILFENGQVIDREQIRVNRICVNAEDTINSGICGINLMYQAPYTNFIKLGYDRYELFHY